MLLHIQSQEMSLQEYGTPNKEKVCKSKAFYIMMIVPHHYQKPELMGRKKFSKPSSVNSGTV